MEKLLLASGIVALLAGCALVGPVGRPAELRPEISVPSAASPPVWSADDAIVRLREGLSRRGLGPDVADGPMAPEGRLADGPYAGEGRVLGSCSCEAWQVVTAAGRWWVWPTGQVEPADSQAWNADQQVRGDDVP